MFKEDAEEEKEYENEDDKPVPLWQVLEEMNKNKESSDDDYNHQRSMESIRSEDLGSVASKRKSVGSVHRKKSFMKASTYKKQWTILDQQISELSESEENNTDAGEPRKNASPDARAAECQVDNDSYNYSGLEKQEEPSKYPTFKKGKYELIRLIGQGMTSKVFMIRLASDHNQIFALKVIMNSYYSKREEYILNEVQVLISFKGNPHIIQLYEYGRASFLDVDGQEWG